MTSPTWSLLRRFYPLAAFLGGFVWDALTLGQRVTPLAFWRLGAYLLGSALLILLLARRHERGTVAPAPGTGFSARGAMILWQAPYLLMQFLYGGIFSALFILYFKSAGHLGTWLMTAFLGALLVGNEFAGDRYGRRFTLTWSLFALNAILLLNFVMPHVAGSLDSRWFYLSTGAGLVLTHGVRWLAPGHPGRIWPVWMIAASLVLAWSLNMVAPVPLVKRDLAVGHDFESGNGRYALSVEPAPAWQFWRDQATSVHVQEGERLYGLSAVFAPPGVTALLEHRWAVKETSGWRQVATIRFQSTGGRDKGFRGHSWVNSPAPGDWRFTVATQDGRIIGVMSFQVERAKATAVPLIVREF